MNELKAHLFCESDEFFREYPGPLSNDMHPYYLKSEADKVIAELKADYNEACGRLQTANLIKDEQLAATRHQKYKRCLAMAEWCEARYDEEDAKVNGCGASWEYISKEMKYWERWRWRWDALAEEPTWAKFLQLIHKEAK